MGATVALSSTAQAQVAPIIQCQGRPVTQLAFSNPTQVAGATPLGAGAVYRYSSIANGIDAEITIVGFANGGSLNIFDNDVPANNASGPRLVNYFQPELVSTGDESAADFRIDFLQAGTNIPAALDIAMSAIDVDGNGNPNGTLREFAEFDAQEVGYVLDANTRLTRSTADSSSPSRVRFTPQTDQFAPGIDPTAEDVIATNFYTDVTTLEYRIGTVGTGGGTRLTSVGFDCPNLTTPVPESTQDEDFGDAPASYGNAIHTIDAAYRLGSALSADTGPYDSPNATGDDDDGANFPDFLAGQTQNIPVTVSGANGRLQAWIDWNRNGSFTDSGEQVATNVADGNNDGTIDLSVTAPINLSPGQTIARLRWSSVPNVDHQEAADDGEVEDFAFDIDRPTPFACDGQLYQIAQNTSTLKRLNITQSGSGYTANLVNVAGVNFQVNAGWGFSEQDDVIYGVRSGTQQLWRIDAQGRFTQLGNVTGPATRNGSNAGDVLPDGRMVYKTGNARWTLLDLTNPLAPTVIGDIPLSQSVSTIDFGVNPLDGRLYGVNNTSNRLYYVDISGGPGVTAQVVEFGPASYNGGFGAAWFDERGNMYLYDNNTNRILMIDVGVNGDGPALPIELAVSTNDEGGINDGAYCRGPAPVPLGAISGALYEDDNTDDTRNSGEGGLPADIAVSLYWDNGTPGDASDDTLIKTVNTDANGAFLFDNQVTVETFRVEVDTNDAEIPSDRIIGTTNPILGITVSANSTTANQNFGFDQILAELDASKTVSVWNPGGSTGQAAYMLPGNDVVYKFEVTNVGNGTITDGSIFLLDTLPDEVDLWNGDFEDGAPDNIPGSDTVGFESSDPNLGFDGSTDFRVAYGATPPTSFADCQTIAQSGNYEQTARHVCLRVTGAFAPADPDPAFSWSLRARIR